MDRDVRVLDDLKGERVRRGGFISWAPYWTLYPRRLGIFIYLSSY